MTTATAKAQDYKRIWEEATQAAQLALKECQPTPMMVQQHTDSLDDSSPVAKEWFVPDGLCGFAWVIVRPGTSSFAKWLKAQGHGDTDHYYGGVCVWVRAGGQSVARKEAYAEALAKVLQRCGIDATAASRLD